MASVLKSRDPFLISFRQKFTGGKRLTMFMIFLQLLGFPLIALVLGLEIYLSEYQKAYDKVLTVDYINFEGLSLISVFSLIAATGCGLIIVIENFSYLFKRDETDTYLSLPITRKQRFWSQSLAGLAQYMFPYLIGTVVSIIVFLVFFFMTASLPNHSVGEIVKIFIEDDRIKELITIIFKSYICLILTCIMFYALCMAVAMCCGRVFEAAAYPIALNIILPLLIAEVSHWIFGNMYGAKSDYVLQNVLFLISSPVGGAFHIIYALEKGTGPISAGAWTAFAVGFIALYTFAAYKFYMRRKAEDVGRPFALKLLFYIVECIMIFGIMALQSFNDYKSIVNSTTITAIIMSLIFYVMLELVSNRKQKRYIFSVIRFFSALLGSFLILFIASYTNFFGLENYIPSVSSISSATMTLNSPLGMEGTNVVFKSDENLELITKAHKKALKVYRNDDYPRDIKAGQNTSFEFTYKFKWGLTQSREYYYFYSYDETLFQLLTSDEFVDNLYDLEKLTDKPLIIQDATNNESRYCYSNKQDIIKAYLEDTKMMTYEEFYNPDIVCYIKVHSDSDFLAVPKSFVNTQKALKENLKSFDRFLGEAYNN